MNWCHNGLTLKHTDPAMIDRAQHCDGLLMEFLPTPDALRETSVGFFREEDMTTEQRDIRDRNIQMYGSADWYDWNIRNWGIKWDFEFEAVDRVDAHTLTVSFDSALKPPVEAYAKLEEMGFEIDAKYYEPEMCFVGTYVTDKIDCTISYTGNPDTIREEIGEELDDYFGISKEVSHLSV